MSLDRQPTWLVWLWMVLAPLLAFALVADASDQWQSDVWLRSAYYVRYPQQDVAYAVLRAFLFLALAVAMTMKALSIPVVPRSGLVIIARLVCMVSLFVAGFAQVAKAWAVVGLL